MVKQWVAANIALYGAYMLATGPLKNVYRQYFTLDANSSFLSLGTCHIGHTSLAALAINSGVMWTLGNSHVRKFGCAQFAGVLGLSMGLASVMGLVHLQSEPKQVIAGGAAGTAGLITYNVFKNPQWFASLRFSPLLLLAALTTYGVFQKDQAVLGGVGGGYLAVILAL